MSCPHGCAETLDWYDCEGEPIREWSSACRRCEDERAAHELRAARNEEDEDADDEGEGGADDDAGEGEGEAEEAGEGEGEGEAVSGDVQVLTVTEIVAHRVFSGAKHGSLAHILVRVQYSDGSSSSTRSCTVDLAPLAEEHPELVLAYVASGRGASLKPYLTEGAAYA